jgi:electron transport complex protein RnfA
VADTSLLLLGIILTNNFVLPRTLGFFPYRGDTGRFDNPWTMGLVTASVLIPASAASYPIDRFLLARYDIEYLWLVVTMFIIAVLVQLAGLVYRARDPRIQPMLRFYLPLIVTNCTILAAGSATTGRHLDLDLLGTLIHALAASVGFTIAIAMFTALNACIDTIAAPPWFRGAPLTLIGIGLTLLAFMGLTGVP